jgi:putative serine protease PepD
MTAGFDQTEPGDRNQWGAPSRVEPPRPPTGYPSPGSYPTGAYPPTGPFAPTGPPPVYPSGQPAHVAGGPRRRAPVLAILVGILVLIVAVQAFFLIQLRGRVDSADRHLAAEKAANAKSVDTLDGRVKALEQRAAQSLDSAAVAAAVLPSVFRIDAGDFTGSAFAVGAPSGGGTYLLTNYHVVASLYTGGGRSVALRHDNERFTAKIVRVDSAQDLALIQSDQTFPRLTVQKTQVTSGTPILVVGAPLGLAQSVTSGIVSAVRSDVPGEGGKTFIQFSAPINPGNSGGPVVNAQKQVVGIASAKATDAEGIGLAIPIKVACQSFSVC